MKVQAVQRRKKDLEESKDPSEELTSSIQRSETVSQQEEEEEEDDLEEDEDSRSYLDEEFLAENEKSSAKTRTGLQSRKSGDFVSRKNSMMSRKGGRNSDMRKDFKRMNTNMSRMSKTSKYSRGSGRSQWSGKSRAGGGSSRRYQGGFFSHYAENNEEEEKENPFDAIFGKDIYKKMKGNKDYVEKMALAEFKNQVPWGQNVFPQFIVDLISYIGGFQIEEFIKQKQ